jgi:hypothetical protein
MASWDQTSAFVAFPGVTVIDLAKTVIQELSQPIPNTLPSDPNCATKTLADDGHIKNKDPKTCQ